MARIRRQDKLSVLFDPLLSVLQITGICMISKPSSGQWNRVWTFFLLFLCVQSNTYVFIKRTCLLNIFLSCPVGSSYFIGYLVQALIRLTSLLCDTVIHIALISTIEKTISWFFEKFESVLCDFNWTNLSLRMQRISLLGLVHLLLSVGEM